MRESPGGTAEMLYPADIGIRGNSHVLMQDKNNLQIADLILKWIDRHTSGCLAHHGAPPKALDAVSRG